MPIGYFLKEDTYLNTLEVWEVEIISSLSLKKVGWSRKMKCYQIKKHKLLLDLDPRHSTFLKEREKTQSLTTVQTKQVALSLEEMKKKIEEWLTASKVRNEDAIKGCLGSIEWHEKEIAGLKKSIAPSEQAEKDRSKKVKEFLSRVEEY